MDLQPSNDDLLRFSHQAMATTFEILTHDRRGRYCSQAANEAFALLDRLETQLSRFLSNSDVARINASTPGQWVLVELETIECLLEATDAWTLTAGGFDITTCGLMDRIKIDPDGKSVARQSEALRIDLGGIGKGFALEQMAKVMSDWRIQDVLLHAGSSTVLAMDGQWPVSISCPLDGRILGTVSLHSAALSCSSQTRRPHIIDPATGRPADRAVCSWVMTTKAGMADALSTGLLVAGEDTAQAVCRQLDRTAVFLVVKDGKWCEGIPFGGWADVAMRPCRCHIGYRRT